MWSAWTYCWHIQLILAGLTSYPTLKTMTHTRVPVNSRAILIQCDLWLSPFSDYPPSNVVRYCLTLDLSLSYLHIRISHLPVLAVQHFLREPSYQDHLDCSAGIPGKIPAMQWRMLTIMANMDLRTGRLVNAQIPALPDAISPATYRKSEIMQSNAMVEHQPTRIRTTFSSEIDMKSSGRENTPFKLMVLLAFYCINM